MLKIGFIEAIEQFKKLLFPMVETIKQNKEFKYQWYKDKKEW